MLIKIFNFLLVAGSIQGLLFVIVPLFLKKKIAKPIWFLNGTVLFISFNNLQAWMIDNDYLPSLYFIRYLEVPWHMLIVPFFYSFLIYYLRLNDKFKSFIRLTLFIFIVEILLMSVVIINQYNGNLGNDYLKKYIQLIEMLNAVYTIFIFIKAILIIFKSNHLYDFMLSYDNMKWLKQFIIFGILVIVLWVIGISLNAYVENNEQKFTYYPLRLSSSILIYWIGYQGLIRFNLTQERISLRREFAKETSSIIIDKNASQSNNEDVSNEEKTLRESFVKIEKYILENQLYTDSYLSLNSISEELNINKNLLSKSINSCSGKNFSDYINNFRVQLAKELLIDEKYSRYTITSIGLECGFNSKSTFYTSFNKFVGMTPMSYRSQNS